MDYYEILEVSSTASEEIIKMAYKTLAKKYHPDVYKGDILFAVQKMKEINSAYEVLGDPVLRNKYKLSDHRSYPNSAQAAEQSTTDASPSGKNDTAKATSTANPSQTPSKEAMALAAFFVVGFILFSLTQAKE